MLKILAYANTDRIFSILINNLESRCDLPVVALMKAFTGYIFPALGNL
jgi:hypothetical protein